MSEQGICEKEAFLADSVVGEWVEDWLYALRHMEILAIEHEDQPVSYRELAARVASRAAFLEERGVARGERVAVLMTHGLLFAITLHALRYLGAVIVLINARLSLEEMVWQVDDVEARTLLCDEAHEAQRVAISERLAHVRAWRCTVQMEEGARVFIPAPVCLSHVQSIIYTSGTTGRPKGALLTYGNHFASAVASALRLGMLPTDRWLTALPLFHVGGQAVLMRSVIYGTAAVLQDRFDEAAHRARLLRGDITMVSVVAATLQRMMDDEVAFPAALRVVLLGGGPAPVPLLERCIARGVPVVQTYGLTEANSQVATLRPAEVSSRVGSAGQPLMRTNVRIVDGHGECCPPNGVGEIQIKGPTVCAGYWQEKTVRSALAEDGWFHTGDLGYLDSQGYLFVLDRRKDLIISGGENIYPAEVEAVLLSHPSVIEAAVIGRDDARYGQVPVAVLAVHPAYNESALLSFCRERLAGYKVPKHFLVVDRLPRNAAGKLLKREMRLWL
ncbi:o-succinylbenzoate--CoA ligase [Ferroacidibacillus organovorans]|uniref:2-succinylbenzoate--CoA ligase n=1 Tax=Ferroacidibacillus organovorans TaxID=1765683 RepID=A0A101XRL1_9BACL|nr:o-succinylbenzoate--CoA ligase [Ferroacidibacillus organovorans]KUO96233.1 hypothetical protein ATW55_09740 [Ferroacidibacillus organovorans]